MTDFERGAEAMRAKVVGWLREWNDDAEDGDGRPVCDVIGTMDLPAQPLGESREAGIDQAIEAERPKVRADAAQLAMRLREENTRLYWALRDAANSLDLAAGALEEEDRKATAATVRGWWNEALIALPNAPPGPRPASDSVPDRPPDARPEEKK